MYVVDRQTVFALEFAASKIEPGPGQSVASDDLIDYRWIASEADVHANT